MAKPLNNEIYTLNKAGKIIKSFMSFMPDPDKILRTQGRDISIYRELLEDSHVNACITSREAGILKYEYRIIGEDKKITDYISDQLNIIDIEELIRTIMNSIYFGYSVAEKTLITDGHYIYIEKFTEKPQEWFAFDENSRLVFLSSNKKTELVDMNVVELFQYKPTYTNPYGSKILSKLFYPVAFKKGGIKFWIDFAEKFGSVFLYAKVTGDDKVQTTAEALNSMIQSAVGVFQSGDEIHQLNVEKSGSSNLYKDLIEFCNSEISKCILGQTLTTDTTKYGNYSTAIIHNEVREDIIEADKKYISKYINKIIRKLVDLNFNTNTYPEFIFIEEQEIDTNLVDSIVKLQQAGVKFTKDFFIDKFHFLPEHFEVLNTNNDISNFSENNNDDDNINEYKEIIEEEESIEKYAKKTLNDFKNAFEGFLNDVLMAINNSSNYDEAIEKLLKTLGKDRKNDYETIGKLLLGVDLLVQNQMQKIYNFADDDDYIQDEIDFLKMKVPLNKNDFNKLYDKYKNYGFTIATYQEEDTIAKVLDIMIDTKKQGKGYKEFIKRIQQENLQVSDIVYFQNIRNAQMSAKYNYLMKYTDIYPYWQYVAIMDRKTRPSHRELHGKVWKASDPIWNTIYPPNGFGCRCTVRPLNDDMMKAKSLNLETDPLDFTPDEGFANNVGKDLNWIREKQKESLIEFKDKNIINEHNFRLDKMIKKEGIKRYDILIDVPKFDPKKYKDREYTREFVDNFCKKYGYENKEIDFTDYQGKIIKIDFRELIRHIVEDVNPMRKTEQKIDNEVLNRVKRLKYIKFVSEILNDPDIVIANIYAKKSMTLKTKVSKAYIKKIYDGKKDEFVVLAINYDRENPQYQGITLYTTDQIKGWVIK